MKNQNSEAKYLFYLAFAMTVLFLLSACGGGGGSAASVSDTAPVNGPFDPDAQYYEVSRAWVMVLSPDIEARFSPELNRLYGCDEAFCRGSDARSDVMNPGDCLTYSSATYGSWEVCYSEITEGLTQPESVWLSIKEL